MLTVAVARCAWRRPGESIDSHGVSAARFVVSALAFRVDVMVEPVIRPHAPRFVARLRIVRAAPLDVRAWTGRSAVSAATNTVRPPIATAGTGRTRVSVARLHRSRTWRQRAPRALARPVISPPKPRSLAHPRIVSG
jgi:hypothetical protein